MNGTRNQLNTNENTKTWANLSKNMKTINQIKTICNGLATVQKIRGENSVKITFHKNWGHGKLGGDNSQGTLGRLNAAGLRVTTGHYGNTYIVNLT